MTVLALDRLVTVITFGVALILAAIWVWREYRALKPRPLFRCSGCHRDIYPPVIKSMHYRDKSYCEECEAKYWMEAAETLRAWMK